MAATWCDLKPNRDLLDHKFEGYKLSLESLAKFEVAIPNGTLFQKLSDDQFSYQHLKAFGLFNHLIQDPWNPNFLYFVDFSRSVQQVFIDQRSQPRISHSVFTIPNDPEPEQKRERVQASLYFINETAAFIADGISHIYLLETGDRKQNSSWKVISSFNDVGAHSFIIKHAVFHRKEDQSFIECLLLSVDKNEHVDTKVKESCFKSVLHWLTFKSENDSFILHRRRLLESHRSPDYCSLHLDGSGIFIGSELPFKFTFDSLKPIVLEVEEPKVAEPEDMDAEAAPSEVEPMPNEEPAYEWTNNDEEVSVKFKLEEGITKADITCKITPHMLELICRDKTLLHGTLGGEVTVANSTWTIMDRILELTLAKSTFGAWTTVVGGDNRGLYVVDEELKDRLKHLTSEEWNPKGDNPAAFNSEATEECDVGPEEEAMLQRWDGETHAVTHQTSVSSHQVVFTSLLNAGELPVLCLRHDVDALVWQLHDVAGSSEQTPWTHEATFHAFGYVQAAKQNRKFISCASDFSAVVIADSTRRAYIYHRPEAAPTVRNRRTGATMGAVAKQQVVTVDTNSEFLGMVVTPNSLALLTDEKLFAVNIRAAAAADGEELST